MNVILAGASIVFLGCFALHGAADDKGRSKSPNASPDVFGLVSAALERLEQVYANCTFTLRHLKTTDAGIVELYEQRVAFQGKRAKLEHRWCLNQDFAPRGLFRVFVASPERSFSITRKEGANGQFLVDFVGGQDSFDGAHLQLRNRLGNALASLDLTSRVPWRLVLRDAAAKGNKAVINSSRMSLDYVVAGHLIGRDNTESLSGTVVVSLADPIVIDRFVIRQMTHAKQQAITEVTVEFDGEINHVPRPKAVHVSQRVGTNKSKYALIFDSFEPTSANEDFSLAPYGLETVATPPRPTTWPVGWLLALFGALLVLISAFFARRRLNK